MLLAYLNEGSLKRTLAAEPLVNDDPQRVLVAGRPCLPAQLFGRQVQHVANNIQRAGRTHPLHQQRQADAADQQFVMLAQQQVARL